MDAFCYSPGHVALILGAISSWLVGAAQEIGSQALVVNAQYGSICCGWAVQRVLVSKINEEDSVSVSVCCFCRL